MKELCARCRHRLKATGEVGAEELKGLLESSIDLGHLEAVMIKVGKSIAFAWEQLERSRLLDALLADGRFRDLVFKAPSKYMVAL